MVDQLVDRGLQLNPQTEWTLLPADEVVLLLPSRSSYRGLEVVTFDLAQPAVVLIDPAGVVDALYLNLTTGTVGSNLLEAGLT